jgi:hypothetical protein
VKGNYHKKYRKPKRYRPQKEKQPKFICPVCDKPINIISTAIVHKETNKKAHFDCIVKELKKYYHLKPNEGICYLGGGGFGIIESLKNERSHGFVIKRRIQYENR